MAMKPLENFSPVFFPSKENPESAYTLLLLHGTGGSENDLIPIGRVFGKKINLLSICLDFLKDIQKVFLILKT